MKLIFTFILLSFTIHLYAEKAIPHTSLCDYNSKEFVFSPDSLDFCILKYPDDISIPNCTGNFQTGFPIIDDECVENDDYFLVYSDTEIVECEHIQRRWIEYNNNLQKIDTFFQNIYIDPNVGIECIYELEREVTEGPELINIRDLIVGYDESISYSFGDTPSDTILLLEDTQPLIYQQKVNNLDDGSFCFTEITKVNCQSYNPDVITSITLVGHKLFSIRATDFINGNDHLCDTITYQLRLLNGPYGESVNYNTMGQDIEIPMTLRYRHLGILKFHTVYANLINTPSDTLIFQLDNIYLSAGEEYEIPFKSPNFYDISTIQFGLESTSGQILDVENLLLPSQGMHYNLVSDELLLFLFISVSTIDRDPEDHLFSVKIKPDSDGYLSDFLSLSEEFPVEAARSDFVDVGIRLEFGTGTTSNQLFLPRSIPRVQIYPNPSNGEKIQMELSNFASEEAKILVKDLNGNTLRQYNHYLHEGQNEILNYTLGGTLPAGIYIIEVLQDSYQVNGKIIIQN